MTPRGESGSPHLTRPGADGWRTGAPRRAGLRALRRAALAAALAGVLGMGALGGGCAPAEVPRPQSYAYRVAPGELLDLGLGRTVTPQELAERLRGVRLLFLGEHHDEPGSHDFQRRTLLTLLEQGRRPVVALEMFPPEANPALAEWTAGELDERAFVARADWYNHWGFPWRTYRPLFALFREHGLEVRGINVTREQRRAASQGDYPDELRQELGDLDLEVEPHRRYLSDTLEEAGHGEDLTETSPEFLRYLRVQALWDHVMGGRAARLTDGLGPDGIVVVLIGSGHLAYRLGANLRAARMRPAVGQLTVMDRYVQQHQLDDEGRFPVPVGLADVVRVALITPSETKPPTLAGLQLADVEAGVRVERLGRFTPTRLRQFREGDVIHTLNGERVTDTVGLRLTYEDLPPTSRAEWVVVREGESVRLTIDVR